MASGAISAHITASARVSARDTPVVIAVEFSPVVGQDDDGAPCLAAALRAYVVGRIQHGASNVGAAIEPLLAKQAIEFALNVRSAALNGNRTRVERSNTIMPMRSSLPSTVSACPDASAMRWTCGRMLALTSSRKKHVYRHLLAGKIADRLRSALLAHHKIVHAQMSDRAVARIHHLRVHTHQRHIAAEHDIVIRA